MAEDQAVGRLLHQLELTGGARHRAVRLAVALVEGARARRDERPFLDAFLQEFGLSNQEGIALMCIAEALLRIPDDATADRLIAEQLQTGDWSAHAGKSESLFVNASTWGLMLTGGILELDPAIKNDAAGWIRQLTRKAGEPLVRLAVRRAMKIIGGEFVVGRSIEEALERSAREADVGLCSFDMLGEGARTLKDAERYLESYEHAIEVIGRQGTAPAHDERSSISIKLSALEPRYALLQQERVMAAAGAEDHCARPPRGGRRDSAHHRCRRSRPAGSVAGRHRGARPRRTRRTGRVSGLAVQAYSKRALDVIDWVAAIAREAGRRMTVRLVKGAYWDSEIKRSQERGLEGYPVYTRKITTDVSYLACAGRLFKHTDVIFPQFATHNAHSIAAVLSSRRAARCMSFSGCMAWDGFCMRRPHATSPIFRPCACMRRSASTRTLLAYLVRRLLENGANTSFVNRFMDEQVPVARDRPRSHCRARAARRLYASAAADARRPVFRSAQLRRPRSGQPSRRSRPCAWASRRDAPSST